MQKIKVKTWYLEHNKHPQEEIILPVGVSFEEASNITTKEYLDIYHAVGDEYGWTGRLIISESELKEILTSKCSSVFYLKVDGAIAGFFELDYPIAEEVEIIYFGLKKEFIGKGLGKLMMQQAIHQAWSMNPQKVWLHTCEMDHAGALGFYEKMGFRVVDERIEEEYYSEEFLKENGN